VSGARLRVALYSLEAPAFPCARLRILDPAEANAGSVTLRAGVQLTPGSLKVDLSLLEWCDVVLLQRGFPGRQAHEAGVIDRMIRAGKPIVYETDDDFASIPDWHGKEQHRENAEWIRRLLPHVSLVTVSTEVLRQRLAAHHPHIMVLPNCVNQALWPVHEPVAAGLRDPHIVYAGNRGHWRDLESLERTLTEALQRHRELHVTIMGVERTALASCQRVSMLPFNGDYALYPRRLAALGATLAVVPLLEHPFNEAISPIKFLEFAAVGIPGVFQDMAPYATVRPGEDGLRAGVDADAWAQAIDALVTDDGLRQSLAANANRRVRSEFLLSQHAHRWLDAWQSVRR
jgi:glycosyltransferase involved in cell wall biosynthesis